MKVILTIARREHQAYFSTPMGWMCLCGFVALTGFFFAAMTGEFAVAATRTAMNPFQENTADLNSWLIQPFFANTAVVLLMLCPALSMRLFAEDRKHGSLELLLSSPISSAQIVLGKYLGAMSFLGVMLASTLPFTAILYWLGSPDNGVMFGCYLATFLMSASFIAVGMLTSSMTINQMVALVLGFGMLLGLWVLPWAAVIAGPGWGDALADISMLSHIDQLMKGLVHTKDIVYFVSFTGLFLFATTQRVEAYRWR
jgi:ABC-2 type transport system permease protein